MTDLLQIQSDGQMVEAGDGSAIAVPSGQEVSLMDVIWNVPGPTGLVTRFRFLAPAIARDKGQIDFDAAAADMMYLCQTFAMPKVESASSAPTQIIISLSDRPLPFGQSDPEATQFFEAYRLEGGACIWEVF
jgi:hypothetical protein